jgi:hypothetical protein
MPSENWRKIFRKNLKQTPKGAGWELNLKIIRYKNKSQVRWNIEGVPKPVDDAAVICTLLCDMVALLNDHAEREQKS